MSEYKKTVEVMECDYYRQLPPKLLMEHCLSATLYDVRAEGLDRVNLCAATGAVWMISHMRFYQYAPINASDDLIYKTFPRVIEGNRYIFYVEVYREGQLIARTDFSYIPVHKAERRVIRISQVEPLWKTPPRNAVTKYLHRLHPHCEFTDCGRDSVRMSDTDCNHHMTSGAYLALACNALNFWGREESVYMKMMQVDYASEVLPNTELTFQKGEENGTQFVRGIKPDGKIAFTAACIF